MKVQIYNIIYNNQMLINCREEFSSQGYDAEPDEDVKIK